ncbi:hypothetical protein BDV97DRAFT_288117 [Delphinella strobiligena]|nr:hypothetical protein BDV97DRAFT_288117 [Delphinella strobiligena]
MFIGGLNWETTDQSLRDYFSQFGEVVECTVMRDGATGRSRGFGFLTFRDPKTVNIVMVKEHQLDGKIIDPKRAIPRDEQERTSKIFVGGVSQEATEQDFKNFFMQFGRVLDATLMMDKDTGRPRGFGFVTFDSEAAVDRTLERPLEILGKYIEVKKAQPRGNIRDDNEGGNGRFNKHNKFAGNNAGAVQGGGFNGGSMCDQGGQGMGGANGMSPAMMAQYWQRMQQYFQQSARMGSQTSWEGMYDDVPAPGGGIANQGGMGGGQGGQGGHQAGGYRGGRGGRGRGGMGMYHGAGGGNMTPQGPAQAPINAPTGPKNAGKPGANYRGGGRGGGHRGFHPYGRGGAQ